MQLHLDTAGGATSCMYRGAVDGVPSVAYRFKKITISLFTIFSFHGNLKKVTCRMSNLKNTLCHVVYYICSCHQALCRMSILKKWPCRRFEFKGQEPLYDCVLRFIPIQCIGSFLRIMWLLYIVNQTLSEKWKFKRGLGILRFVLLIVNHFVPL